MTKNTMQVESLVAIVAVFICQRNNRVLCTMCFNSFFFSALGYKTLNVEKAFIGTEFGKWEMRKFCGDAQ